MFSGQITNFDGLKKTEVQCCRVSHPRTNKKHGVIDPSSWLLVLLLMANIRRCGGACSPQSTVSHATRELKIALLLPLMNDVKVTDQVGMSKAADWILRKLNDECVVPGYNLTYQWYNTQCHPGRGITAMTEAKVRGGAKAFIGKYNGLRSWWCGGGCGSSPPPCSGASRFYVRRG